MTNVVVVPKRSNQGADDKQRNFDPRDIGRGRFLFSAHTKIILRFVAIVSNIPYGIASGA